VDWFVFVSEQWVLVSLLAILVSALIVVEKKRAGVQLSSHEATRLLNDGSAVIVDLRESKEYSAGHIVDALNIPYAKLKDRAVELEKHKSKTIVLVDKMGQHTGAGVKQLGELGYECARLQGGMVEWQSQNLPVVKG
jgi:rhodanese-related sulfurtransferase